MSERRGVVVVGSFMADLVFEAPRRPMPGETLVGTGFGMYLGGKGFNQAVAAARAGASVAMIGRLGADDFGHRFLAQLERDGIDSSGVVVDADEGTGVAGPLVEPDGANSIVTVARANHRLSPHDVEAAGGAIDRAAVVLLQLEVPLEASLAAARRARASGATVVLNPAPALGPAELAGFAGVVDILVPNEVEAVHLAEGGAPLEAAAVVGQALGASVLVTVGAEGAWLVGGDASVHIPPHPVDAVDTVGAGDAFCGALGARLAAGDDLRSAAAYASAAAALSVTRRGAEPAMPTAAEVDALLARAPARTA